MYHILHEQEFLSLYLPVILYIDSMFRTACIFLITKLGIRFLQALSTVWCPVFYADHWEHIEWFEVMYILIVHYNMGIEGAAVGYVISNW